MENSILNYTLSKTNAADHSQSALIARCLAGEEYAYNAVYIQYAPSVYRICFGLLQHREDSEEVLQDVFEYAFRRLVKYDAEKASFKTWLYQIAVSRCRNKRRRKWLASMPLSQYLVEKIADQSTPTPLEAVNLSERQHEILKAIGNLSPKLRETAILRYYEGMTYSEIGQILSISPKTAESRMRLAHKSLKAQLSDSLGK